MIQWWYNDGTIGQSLTQTNGSDKKHKIFIYASAALLATQLILAVVVTGNVVSSQLNPEGGQQNGKSEPYSFSYSAEAKGKHLSELRECMMIATKEELN